jgi:ribonuclease HII
MRVLGIDEAGRGCVLGPLVVAGFLVIDVDPALLSAAGAADSKKLSPARRLAARHALGSLGQASIQRIEATTIDDANLNAVEEEAIASLIRQGQPDVVLIDALGHPRTLPRVVERLRSLAGVRDSVRILMEPGADGRYPEVGAASVFAKTYRDAALDEYRSEFGEFGSGYPSDPKTRGWLSDWKRSGRPWPPFVRTRWGTVRDLDRT